MKNKKYFITGLILICVFAVWTIMIQTVDVKLIGQGETKTGFASFNLWFHTITGVNMILYYITDWFGLVPIFCCFTFGITGLIQLIKRKNLFKVDTDIIISGIYYIVIILLYLFFEMIPINYRPVLIDGMLETSYPSSTTLLVLSVMPTVSFLTNRRLTNEYFRTAINISVILFSVFMIIGRTLSGVHWLTDIIGSFFASTGVYLLYKNLILRLDTKQEREY